MKKMSSGVDHWIVLRFVKPSLLVILTFNPPLALAQLIHRPSWDELGSGSAAIVVATAREESWIVRKDRMRVGKTQLPDGSVRLRVPWPKDYVVARFVRFDIDEILKWEGQTSASLSIDVYLAGWFPGEHTPIFVKGQQYLLFLKPMRVTAKSFEGLTVIPANEILDEGVQVDPSHFCEVVDGANGTLLINEKNLPLLQAAKQAIGRKS